MSGCGAEKGLMSIDEALELIRTQPKALGTEVLALAQGLNRYLAKAIYSEVNLPSFSQSAVDGYAINSSLTQLQDAFSSIKNLKQNIIRGFITFLSLLSKLVLNPYAFTHLAIY